MRYVAWVSVLSLLSFAPWDCRLKSSSAPPPKTSSDPSSPERQEPQVSPPPAPGQSPGSREARVPEAQPPGAQTGPGQPSVTNPRTHVGKSAADEKQPAGSAEEAPLLLEDEPLLLEGEPLRLSDDEPLRLEDERSQAASSKRPVADNSRCHHCHLNYMVEELAVVHARANIGCANCHGNCDAHIADESWASGGNGTAPGIMYRRQEINGFCLGCHPQDQIQMAPHPQLLAGKSKEKYCTDCHGQHRLAKRKCKWK